MPVWRDLDEFLNEWLRDDDEREQLLWGVFCWIGERLEEELELELDDELEDKHGDEIEPDDDEGSWSVWSLFEEESMRLFVGSLFVLES